MADKNETVADIAREMRGMPKDWIVDANANFVFVKYADRIEAAHKREVEGMSEDDLKGIIEAEGRSVSPLGDGEGDAAP